MLARIAVVRSPSPMTTLAAGLQIGRHGAKARRQLIEIGDGATGSVSWRRVSVSIWPCTRPLGITSSPALQSQGQIDQELPVLLLAPVIELGARRPVAKRRLPVQRCHGLLDLLTRHAARIQTADHRTHAGAGDRIDRHVQLHRASSIRRYASRRARRRRTAPARHVAGPGARLAPPSPGASCAPASRMTSSTPSRLPLLLYACTSGRSH
jgi:hypothetical protein